MSTPKPKTSSDILTTKQVAEYLSVTMSGVRMYIRRGHLKAYRRAGNRYLVRRADMLAMLQPHETPDAKETAA